MCCVASNKRAKRWYHHPPRYPLHVFRSIKRPPPNPPPLVLRSINQMRKCIGCYHPAPHVSHNKKRATHQGSVTTPVAKTLIRFLTFRNFHGEAARPLAPMNFWKNVGSNVLFTHQGHQQVIKRTTIPKAKRNKRLSRSIKTVKGHEMP